MYTLVKRTIKTIASKTKHSTLFLLPIVSSTLVSMMFTTANANPWLDTGDMRQRHEIELLSDNAMINVPINTWPLSKEDIASSLEVKKNTNTIPAFQHTIDSINNDLKDLYNFRPKSKIELNAATETLAIRDFSAQGREKASAAYDYSWNAPLASARLKLHVADKTDHPNDKAVRLDDSYVAFPVGNWRITAGWLNRWWGPGWDGSLILSNNARPRPGVSFDRIQSVPFKSRWLRWMGPWKSTTFIEQLESDRGIGNAKLIGTRLTFKPKQYLEVGLHRTIQWGGDGQSQDIENLFETLLGLREDNQNGTLGTVQGNQIAGLDVRWNLPFGGDHRNYVLYGQYIGEDRIDGSIFLGDETFLVGGSVSGFSNKLDGSWRAYVEATDTSAASFKGRARNNIIYNHGTYSDGYRFLDTSLGHSIDSDSTIIGTGFMLSQNNGNFWRGWLKHAKLNEDGIGNNPVAQNGGTWTGIGLNYQKSVNKKLKLDLGLAQVKSKINGNNDSDTIGFFGLKKSF